MAIWYILWPFGISYGHLVHFVAIWDILWPLGIFSRLGILYQFKSGKPADNRKKRLTFRERHMLQVLNAIIALINFGPPCSSEQGDQIRRIFAHCVIAYFGQFFKFQK
jgi:hypothetical protein